MRRRRVNEPPPAGIGVVIRGLCGAEDASPEQQTSDMTFARTRNILRLVTGTDETETEPPEESPALECTCGFTCGKVKALR